VHFTYRAASANEDLQQGDVIELTSDIRLLLRDVHAYYSNHSDYRHLLVLTQTCDLVRRSGEDCKAPYISVAAVRPLRTLLERKLQTLQRSDTARAGRFDSEGTKRQLTQFVKHLFNNNEQGYFYLHGAPGADLAEPQVAFLTLSIALKTIHYERCMVARVLGLAPPFQAKLGWLVGNIYSRVATADWVPAACSTPTEFDEIVTEVINDLEVIWVADRDFEKVSKRSKQAATTKGVSVDRTIAKEVAAAVALEKETMRQRIAAVAETILDESGLVTDASKRETYRQRFENDQRLRQLV
jgi:hypothetical protein